MNENQMKSRRVFLDTDSLTQWTTDLSQRFPQAEKTPIYGLEPGPHGSWDGALTTIWGSVIKEGGLFRMWYWGMREAENLQDFADRPLVCYAESGDGIHWRKPDLKITGQHRYPGNNLLALPGCIMSVVAALPSTDAKYLACTIIGASGIEKDVSDVPGNPREGGTHIFASDDGLHWRHVTKVLLHGDWACLYADRATNRYLLYNKVGGMQGLTSRRIAIGLESRDGKRWEGYDGVRRWRECFIADDYDDLIAQQRGFLLAETYGVGIYRAGEILVSIESIFDVEAPLVQKFAQNPSGLCHLRLGFSHDGHKWRYPKGRPAWLELGAPGTIDAGFIVPASTFVEHGDDLLLYYGGSRFNHGVGMTTDFKITTDSLSDGEAGHDSCRVMMAQIKRDRFASLAATHRGLFDVDADRRAGDELFINAKCPHGQVRVALAEKEGDYHGGLRKHANLPGFSFDDCVPLTGDSVKAPVRFKKASIAQLSPDLPLCIRFEVSRGEVFAYEWAGARRDASAAPKK